MGTRPSSRYQELAPPRVLAPYLRRLWVQEISAGEETYEQPVLPDGYIDIVAVGDQVVLAGPATRAQTVVLAPGARSVGLQFRTGAAPALVGISAAEIRDRSIPLADVWGPAGARLAELCAAETSVPARLRVLVDGLTGRVGRARPLDPVGLGIAGLLDRNQGRRLATVAEDVGLSERQLRRRVEDTVGYPPRTLVRILRFQRFLHTARASDRTGRDLARLAAEAGYADQAHLTRESRELGGLPAGALLAWEDERLNA